MSLKSRFDKFVDERLLPYVFRVSEQPMLFIELLNANKLFQEGMRIDGNVQGFRISLGRVYLVYIIFWHIVIVPPALVFHEFLAKVDCHLLILIAVFFTGLFFAIFSIFNEYLHERMALKTIKEAWINHFPHFKYEQHAREVAQIYSKALEEEIHHKDMRLYILNNMVAEKG